MHDGEPSFIAAALAYESQLIKNFDEDIQRCHEARNRIFQTKFEFSPSFPFQPAQTQPVVEVPMTKAERLMQMKIAEASWWSRFKVWCTPTWNETHAQSAIPDRVPSLTKYQAHPYSHLEKGQGSTASKPSDETGSPRPTASSRLFRSVAKVAVPGLVFADEPVAAPPATSEKESYVFGNYASNVASRPSDCRGTLCDSWIYCGCPYQYSCKHTRHICPPRALPVFVPRVPQPALLEATQTESTEKKQNLLCKHIEWSHATK